MGICNKKKSSKVSQKKNKKIYFKIKKLIRITILKGFFQFYKTLKICFSFLSIYLFRTTEAYVVQLFHYLPFSGSKCCSLQLCIALYKVSVNQYLTLREM